MIASVRGRVVGLALDSLVIEVGGVGMLMYATPATISSVRVGEEATMFTSLVVREDSLTLYAFADEDERSLFDLLQTATGVGPKLAQSMLAVHSPETLRAAVAHEEFAVLEQVPGIGRKGAQRIVLELKDRIGAPGVSLSRTSPASTPWRDQVQTALQGLGFSARDAAAAIEQISDDVAYSTDGNVDVAAMLKAALRSRHRG